jgi:hypothetical protein
MATKPEIIKLMTTMALAWPKYELSKEAFDVYYKLLQELPFESLEYASLYLMANNIFFPSISQWRNAAINHKPNYAETYE